MLRRITKWVGDLTRPRLARQLRKHGLLFEDILLEREDIQEAIARLPPDVLEARVRRIRRAHDLSLKHEYMPEHLQDYDPFEKYGLIEELVNVRARRLELDSINRL
ncbi:Cytochrome b-c1 complex subunit 7 [Plasmodiophora brassicae]|uniref:Cytochrome b-c1 complex subunit 7 n=1 Tax=Plasmodiophora brassicae TaxID=37360 RepID=A0A0G4IL57_PLABS|nr:hypothetical protein PBRA_004540 [Plasmodiophora brassicae]SPR00106.1 unnamed protein product [Plasmodiophora brassicae]